MMTRAVREGWILRAKSERNQRILIASLTPKGRRLLDRGEQFARAIEQQMWKDVGVSTLTSLTKTMEQATLLAGQLEHPLKTR
jgi:DNA-binding MarR family transcriptional regulator